MRWMIDYDKKMNIRKYTQQVDEQQRLVYQARMSTSVDTQELQRLETQLHELKKALRKPTEWMEKCKCYEQKEKADEAAKRLDLSGIPECFRDADVRGFSVDCYETQVGNELAQLAKLAASNYIEYFERAADAGKGLYFTSFVKGSGKTRLASSIANELISKHEQDVVFIKAADISPQVRKTYKNDTNVTEAEVLQAFYDTAVLVIDDLAVESNTNYTEELLSKILDHRMDKKKVTIVTSNRPIDEIDSLYQKGIVGSRIKKMCIEVHMPEESIRDLEVDKENQSLEEMLFKK